MATQRARTSRNKLSHEYYTLEQKPFKYVNAFCDLGYKNGEQCNNK